MEKIVIEIIRPGRVLKEYYSFNGGPISMGRGFNNDLIIDDPFVSPRHCEIVQGDGVFKIKDCQSKNGIYVVSAKTKQTEINLVSGEEFIIGRTHVKIYLGSHSLEEALPLVSQNSVVSIIRHPVSVWILLGVLASIGWFGGHISIIEKDKHGIALLSMAGMVILMLIWAGFWGVINRIIRHKFDYWVHLSIGCLWYVTYTLFNSMFDYAAFYFNSEQLYLFLSIGLFVAITFFGFWLHFYFATRMTNRARIISSSAIIMVILCLSVMVKKYYDEAQYLNMNFYSSINPPYLGMPRAHSIEEVIKKSSHIFNK